MKLAPGLELPLDAITQTFGILAVRGAGKSNLAAVMAEEMFRARLPFVVVDPVGAWWGLRSSADGKAAGLEILIFGGRHGDIPLEKGGGQLVADLVVDDRLSCILDISEFSEGDKIRFLIDFAERLYARNTEPLHLFLEEADDYIPQRPFREQARLLGAWERIQRRGRTRGLGSTLITQRSASLNKNVLTQIETLFVLRTTSPQDRKAIEGWVEYHGQKREVLESLSQLAPGEAWIWSPQWLKVMKRVQIRRRTTFDSGATPKHVRGARPAAMLADVDLGKMREKMAATIERAKQADPRALRARIVELEHQVATKPTAKIETKTLEVPVLKVLDLQTIQAAGKAIDRARESIERASARLEAVLSKMKERAVIPAPLIATITPPPRRDATVRHVDGKFGAGERRVLAAIAQHEAGVTREQLTVLTGYKRSSRDTYLQRLLAAGMAQRGPDAILLVTQQGISFLGDDFERLPKGQALLEHWLERLPEGEKRILRFVAAQYPSSVSREKLSLETGYQRSSRDTYIQRLSARKLIESNQRGMVCASMELFS